MNDIISIEPVVTSIGTRLRTLRLERKLTAREVAKAVDITPEQLSRIEHGHADPRPALVKRLATFYRVSLFSLVEDANPLQSVPVQGAVGFGKLVTDPMWPQDQWYTILVPASQKYPGIDRRGYEVETPDMDVVYPIGSIVIAIDAPKDIRQIRNNSLVIVERTHDGGLRELFLREVRQAPDTTIWLWPHSNDPRYHQPMPWRREYTIVGQAIGSYREF